MKDLIDKWMNFIEELVKEWPDKDINRTWVKLPNKKLTITNKAKEEVFLICKYQNPVLKMTQLEAQYLDKKSFSDAQEIMAHPFPIQDIITVSLVGEAKKGSASTRKHCLRDITINYSSHQCELCFRSSDVIKKFLTDIFFVQEKITRQLYAKDYPINCIFETVMLRSPFWFIYLDQYGDKYGEKALRARIEKFDPITLSWLRYYARNLDKDINYKSLDRGRDRMEESTWWPVYKEYIIDYKSK